MVSAKMLLIKPSWMRQSHGFSQDVIDKTAKNALLDAVSRFRVFRLWPDRTQILRTLPLKPAKSREMREIVLKWALFSGKRLHENHQFVRIRIY